MQIYGFDQVNAQVSEGYEPELVDEEATMETWLNANPVTLLDEPVLIFGRQYRLDTGVPDLLGLDQFGNVIVFEVKKGDSGTESASEETILSQPQNYAQSLSSYDYEGLDEIYQEYRKRLHEDRWDVDAAIAPEETLEEAFRERFGRRLDPDQYNDCQRIVILAENITDRTATNARYLREQGLRIQCREVRLFHPPAKGSIISDMPILVATTIVDYPLSEVRPSGKGHPAYPEVNRTIVTRTFSEIGDIVQADSSRELVQGFEERQPRIQSQHPNHPETVTYRLYVNPEQESVLVALDIEASDESSFTAIQEHESKFREHGFNLTGNKRHRVVVDVWVVESIEELDSKLLDEIVNQYATLVRLGHQVLTPSGSV